MALDTFDHLIQEIIRWSHREDLDLLTPDFIGLAETAMYANPDEILKIRGTEITLDTVTSGQTLALPADFQSMRSIRLITNAAETQKLSFRAPAQLTYSSGTGLPVSFTVASEIEFNITPDTVYDVEIKYFALAAPLTEANQTNAVLTAFPTIYLYGGLWQAFEYAMDPENAAKNFQLFIGAIKGANKKDKQGRYGPAPAMTPAGTVV